MRYAYYNQSCIDKHKDPPAKFVEIPSAILGNKKGGHALHKRLRSVRHADHLAEPADAANSLLEYTARVHHNPIVSAEWEPHGQKRSVRYPRLQAIRENVAYLILVNIVMERTQGNLKLNLYCPRKPLRLPDRARQLGFFEVLFFGSTANNAAVRSGVTLDGADDDRFSGGTRTDCMVGNDAKDMLLGDAMNDGEYEDEGRVV